MKILIALLVLFTGMLSVNAQQAEKAPTVTLTAEQTKTFQEGLKQIQQASKEVAEAQNRLNSAQINLQAFVYSVMAENGIKPSQWEAIITPTGTLAFQKAPPPTVDKKPDTKP